jgi:hypothetical protein
MALMATLTHARLTELLEYLPESGFFVWRTDRSRTKAGTVAGTLWVSRTRKNYSYISIRIDGVAYPAHRLAWFYMTGVMPPKSVQIDHRFGGSLDNRWDNLREATHTQNQWSRGAQRNGKLKLRGVTQVGDRYRARISVNKKRINLGFFETAGLAATAYKEASEQHHGAFRCR